MYARVWRVIALCVGAVVLTIILMDFFAALLVNGNQGFVAARSPADPATYVVHEITNPLAIEGPIHIGDRVHLQDESLDRRLAFGAQRIGDRFTFVGTTAAGAPTHFVATMTRAPVPPDFWVYEATALAFSGVGLLVALRRPRDQIARTMVALFLSMAVLFLSPVPWLPAWTALAMLLASTFCQVYCASAALSLATMFPVRSTSGVRRWLAAFNPWLTVFSVSIIFVSRTLILNLHAVPPALERIGLAASIVYFAAITVAFTIGARIADPADRKRVNWVAYSLAVGFSGSFIYVVQLTFGVSIKDWEQYFGLTLIAIPIGLGYAIVRHRVVDIGFVVNRALVFGTLSAIVLASFTILEWGLSSAALRISHITSTSVELALALVLGFSMRSLHARVDHFVDDLFFRDRHIAEQAMRTLARDVAYITEPGIAVARVFEALTVNSGATFAAIYAIDGAAAVRIDPAQTADDAVSVDDPALVRMRSSRAPCNLSDFSSALPGARAFPMLVRDTVSGAVVLGAKTNGEEYAPDELSAIDTLALALGNALDALQTAALKREIARVLVDGAPLEALRRTVDAAAWIRGTAQPAGPLVGLGE